MSTTNTNTVGGKQNINQSSVEKDNVASPSNSGDASVVSLPCTSGNYIEQENYSLYNEAPVIRANSGKWVNPFNPDPNSICIEDIAHALSFQCRFGGHLSRFYSVAQHSVNCSYLVDSPEDKLAALLHDASEAYLMDIPRPIKKNLSNYKVVEDGLMKVIAAKFGFQYPLSKIIKQVDEEMLNTEWHCLMLGKNSWKMETHEPYKSKKDFLNLFHHYNRLINQGRDAQASVATGDQGRTESPDNTPTPVNSGWISVKKDGFPEVHRWVLAYVPSREMGFMAVRADRGLGEEWESPFEEIAEGITHWMPLPPTPVSSEGGKECDHDYSEGACTGWHVCRKCGDSY